MGVKSWESLGRPLDRSLSAPTLGSHKHSRAAPVNPRAAKSVESLLEGPAALRKEDRQPQTLLNLSDGDAFPRADASLTGTELSHCPNSPPLNTHAKPVPLGSPEPPGAAGCGPGLESPLEKGGGSRWPAACTQAGGAVLLPPSHLELSQTAPEQREELGIERLPGEQLKTPGAQEDLTVTGASPSPANGWQASDPSLSEGSGAQEGALRFSCVGAQGPDSAPHKLPENATFMEVEVTGPVLIAADNQLRGQEVTLPAMSSACSAMEAESARPDSFFSTDPLSTSDLEQSGRIMFESTDISAAVGFSGSPPEGQQSRPGEEACPSLASALKELHQLLVASYQTASRNEQPGALPEEGTAEEEIFTGKRGECRTRDEQDAALPSPKGTPGRVGSEASAGVPSSGAGAEGGQETQTLPAGGALILQEPLDLDSAIVLRPPGGGCSAPSPPCFSSDQTTGNGTLAQNRPPSSLAQGGESWSGLDLSPGKPGEPVSSSADEPAASNVCPPEMDSATPQPPVPPSMDTDQIVRAGFTAQEACEALERADGDVDLALLILLAKKIVVPT